MSTATGAVRVEAHAAFVLHSYPIRETSLLVEAFTRGHGRVALMARGARRPKSALRGQLMAFQPVMLGWTGKSEIKTLTGAEWQAGVPQLSGLALLCGFYLNELLIKLLPREDAHEALFAHYAATLESLAQGNGPNAVLRDFELRLLDELGYGLVLEREADSDLPIEAGKHYEFVPQRGAIAGTGGEGAVQFRGKTLLDMAARDFSDPTTAKEGKQLLRMVLQHHLGDRELRTRQLLKDLHAL